MNTYAKARVQLTIEIALNSSWGDGCTVEQVRKQAVEGAVQAVRCGLIVSGLTNNLNGKEKTPARVVGEPKVTMILTDGETR